MPLNSSDSRPRAAALLGRADALLQSLFARSRAPEFEVSYREFLATIERALSRQFPDSSCSDKDLDGYLQALHLDDLVLAGACMRGSETAWACFVEEYRPYLRAAAGSIVRSGRSGTDAHELADSLFAELYGLADGKRGERSLFRYYHGRSSLKTWLRAILAQRHVDRIRETRRFESLEPGDGEGDYRSSTVRNPTQPVVTLDPKRQQYLTRFSSDLSTCLKQLPSKDRERLDLYYVHEWTLADIGRKLQEHESSVSRNLERIRRSLRASVEELLRCPPALSEAEIALCFQYASEDVPIDFRDLFPESKSGDGPREGKESS